jgi:hypothetical protein
MDDESIRAVNELLILRDDMVRVRSTLRRTVERQDRLLKALETIQRAVRNPLTTGADLMDVCCEQLQALGYDTDQQWDDGEEAQ